MLPTYHRVGCPCFPSLVPPATFSSFLSSFCHRLAHLSLMDLQFSFAQFSLLVCSPRKVYEFANIRKKQKNYYARDDPGFLLLLLFFFLVTGLAYGLAFSDTTVGCILTIVAPAAYLLLSALLIPPLIFLFLHRRAPEAATATRRSSSRFGEAESFQARAPRQRPAEGRAVASGKLSRFSSPSFQPGPPELFFCFDVHWNASFVYLLFGLVLQFFVFPVLRILPTPLACLLGNSLQVVALTSYCYITALGYTSLNFAESPLPFFVPAAVFLMGSVVATAVSVSLADMSVQLLLFFEHQVSSSKATAPSVFTLFPNTGATVAVLSLDQNGGSATGEVLTKAPGSVPLGDG